jgi:hypothetical protein
MHDNCKDPADSGGLLTSARELSPDQRLDELSALLAIGVRRVLALRAGPDLPATQPPSLTSTESGANCLDLSRETSVHASRVVNTRGERERTCT